MAELANCSRCGNVFIKGLRDICQDCYNKEEEAFETVYKFLSKQKNRTATMMEVVEETEVEEFYISKFIREKRLLLTKFPNLSYPCEVCGTGIQTGRICKECQQDIIKDLRIEEELEQRSAERSQENKSRVHTYYTIDYDERK